jgi:hypothetical protein
MRDPGSGAQRVCAWAAVGALAVVLGATLLPVGGPGPAGFQWRVLAHAGDLADLISNVLLFLPLGAALRCAGLRGRRVIAAAVLLSAMVEFAQLQVIPGRDASLSDLLSDTTGAALGVALAAWYPARRRSPARGVVFAAVGVAVMVVTGLLERPSLPATRYYGQWTANLGHYEWYRGQVLSAEIGGMPLPSRRLDHPGEVRRRLLAGTPLRIGALAGPPPPGVAPLFSIFDDARTEIVLVGLDGEDLVLHVRSRADDLLLRPVERRWSGALRDIRPGDRLSVTVRRTAGGFCLAVNGVERCGLAPDAGQAWSLVQSVPVHGGSVPALLCCLTMFLLGLPAGLMSVPRGRGWWGPGLVVAGGATVPLAVGLAPSPILQLAALAAGAVAGALLP